MLKNVLVTGANGFIGQQLIRKLISNGVKINAFIRNSKRLQEFNITIFEGEILNTTAMKKALKGTDAVFHLIAKTHDFSDSENNTKEYFKINVEGTRNLLNACIGSDVKHFVYFSSIKAIAEESKDILNEDIIPNPTTPYGQTKLIAEKLVAEYGSEYSFKTTSIRLPLVYGPGNKGNIYKMIEAIERGRFIMIGRGENMRSMVYVGNVVDAALAVVEKQQTNNEVYIVTDKINYTVKELYEVICNGLGKKPLSFYIPISIANGLAKIGDIGGHIIKKPLSFNSEVLRKLTSSLTFSSQKIQDEIGFEPKYNLYNTINETIKWYKSISRKS